jgi:hypothetical protein
MEIFHPGNKIYFGKHAGYKLSEIYRFFPSYIEFLIAYVPNFIIDEKEFFNLPHPTPYIEEILIEGKGFLKVFNGNSISRTYQYLRDGNKLLPVAYKFPRKTLEILDLKRRGLYKTPQWKRSNCYMINIPFENICSGIFGPAPKMG